MDKTNGIYGKMGASVKGTLYDPDMFGTPDQVKNANDAIAVDTVMLPSGGKMVSGSANQLRNYITRDIEITEKLRKDFETEQIITAALRMQITGLRARLPRPKPLAVYVQHAVDNWSDYK